MNIKQIITVGIAGMAMGVMALDNVEVTDVKARQRYPWNGKVDIDFTLDSKATEPYQMQVEVYDNVGKTNLPVKSVCTEGVSIEANPCMVRTDTRRIVWDASKDLPNGFKCTNVLVTCRDARLLSVSNLYCVIDLQTGAKTYLDKIPAGGWTDEHKTTKMVFRRIEAGSFMMGCPENDTSRLSNESYHQVTLTKSYYISLYEITESQVANISGGNSTSKKPAVKRYDEWRGQDMGNYGAKTTYYWPDSSAVAENSVIGILRKRTGITELDLPTEAQWECAARGDVTTALSNGAMLTADDMNLIGRYEGNKSDQKGDVLSQDVTNVGVYQPNAICMYDMLGNAAEWCRDVWSDDLGVAAVVDPVGNTSGHTHSVGYARGGVSSEVIGHRVVKGGGYWLHLGTLQTDIANLTQCRMAWRTWGGTPAGDGADSGHYLIGTYGGSSRGWNSAGAHLVFLAE